MKSGAPFPLVNRTDVLSKTSGAVVRELMIQELEAGRMPLRPATIDAESKATLLAWLKQGAPAVPAQTCVASVEAGLDGAGGDGGTDGGADVQAGDAADDASDGASVD